MIAGIRKTIVSMAARIPPAARDAIINMTDATGDVMLNRKSDSSCDACCWDDGCEKRHCVTSAVNCEEKDLFTL